MTSIYGAVAQLARATGSYPVGRVFESHRRYHYVIYSNYYSSSFFINDKLSGLYYKDDKYNNVINDMHDDIKNLDLNKEKDDFEK